MKRKKKNSLLMAILSLVLIIAVTGCSTQPQPANSQQGGEQATGPSGNVMLYSSMQEAQVAAIIDGFMEKYPNIKADFYFAGTGSVVTKIATEHQSGQVAADVIWVGDPANYITFKEQGILEKYTSSEAAVIADQFKDPEEYFIGARLVGTGLGYNLDLVAAEDAPRTWKDLLDPKWKDQIIMTDPGASGTTNYLVSALMGKDEYGVSFFEKLKANGAEVESGTTATHNRIAAGEYKVGLTLDFVSSNLIAQGARLGFNYADEDLILITSPIGLVKNSANQENGKLLYDFILSKEGQEILAANNLISVREDVEQTASLSIEELRARSLTVDDAELAANGSEVLATFDRIFK